MNSYNKLAKLRDETIYQIKKALESRKLHQYMANEREKDGQLDKQSITNFQNLQNAITFDELLNALVKLYEID